MPEAKPKTVTIDGKEYSFDDMSDELKGKIGNLRFVEAEMVRLRNQLVVYQAARTEFARQVQKELPTEE